MTDRRKQTRKKKRLPGDYVLHREGVTRVRSEKILLREVRGKRGKDFLNPGGG